MELVPTLVLTFLTQAIDNNKFTTVHHWRGKNYIFCFWTIRL